eukprot:gb/GEZN01003024.1/.p1 GENE.gb/GEZN01003024.1/~~gb/GEZN01003024.1/.p1  ORF type:complete len:763 (+),score=151.79 gb/GEZN01003024.1/:290-2290(+)
MFMDTRPEWLQVAQACFREGVVLATVYATLGLPAVSFVCQQTDAVLLFTSEHLVKNSLQALALAETKVKAVVYAPDKPKGIVDRSDWPPLEAKCKPTVKVISLTEFYQSPSKTDKETYEANAKHVVAKFKEEHKESLATQDKEEEELNELDNSGIFRLASRMEEEDDEEIQRRATKDKLEHKGNSKASLLPNDKDKKEEKKSKKEKHKVFQTGYGPTADDPAVIMYTSGSTGKPKGVILTHRNLLAVVRTSNQSLPPLFGSDVYAAYLPLAHILELNSELQMLFIGATVGYCSPRTLFDSQCLDTSGQPRGDLTALKPTLLASVPLVLDRLKTGVEQKLSKAPAALRGLFKLARYFKLGNYSAGKTNSKLWNWVIFDRFRAALGGHVRFILTGSAPLTGACQNFVRTAFSPCIQGYGMTETCGIATVASKKDASTDNVGAPCENIEVKLVSVPEMGYLVTDKPTPRGEVYVKGAMVAAGYFQMPEKTQEVFKVMDNGDRWFASGDIGTILPNGNLKIIDRQSDLVKLKAGEYIALSNIEASLRANCGLIDHMCLCANGFASCPVALIHPDEAALQAWVAKSRDPLLQGKSMEELCQEEKVKEAVMAQIKTVGNQLGLNKWEVPDKIFLCHEQWTSQNGLLTAGLKMRRFKVQEKYKERVMQMLPAS